MPITRTPIIDDDGSGMTGTIVNSSWKTEFYNQIDALILPFETARGAWTAYTPVWANTSGGAAIGNGTIAGRYLLNGKTVHFTLGMVAGSSSTFGPAGGIYSWTLPPFNPLAIVGTNSYQFTATLLSNAGAAQPPTATYSLSPGVVYCMMANGGLVGAAIPFTWVSGCTIAMRGTYDIP